MNKKHAGPHPRFDSHPIFSRAYIAAQPLLERVVHSWRVIQGQAAQGAVLVIGAGTGLDIPTIPLAPSSVTLLEPDETFFRFLRQHYPDYACLYAPVEHIPLPDQSMDTILSSLVLCSVQDLVQALDEIYRVLIPGGQFLFLEHVAQDNGPLLSVQRRVNPLWGKIGGGCQLDRPVIAALESRGFDISSCQRVHHSILVPVIRGRAVRPHLHQNPLETLH